MSNASSRPEFAAWGARWVRAYVDLEPVAELRGAHRPVDRAHLLVEPERVGVDRIGRHKQDPDRPLGLRMSGRRRSAATADVDPGELASRRDVVGLDAHLRDIATLPCGEAHPGEVAANVVDDDVDVVHADRTGGLAGEGDRCPECRLDDLTQGGDRCPGGRVVGGQLARRDPLDIGAQVLEAEDGVSVGRRCARLRGADGDLGGRWNKDRGRRGRIPAPGTPRVEHLAGLVVEEPRPLLKHHLRDADEHHLGRHGRPPSPRRGSRRTRSQSWPISARKPSSDSPICSSSGLVDTILRPRTRRSKGEHRLVPAPRRLRHS